ncbi:MAG: OmpA family protein [Sinimarinibacterium flocculans]|uniref:OOP family OmpA-OmpF porin n=1 Tax=Sinimarinibacterium flocculans TaxID=985250 RepID=A0A318E5Y7_9GAMM|nr:OmpA family protein [Sinimarinibacterium flocculans]MEC9361924.1 OmpA family protein [Pseudomonadota bacterium]PXV63960.1 OOP family OmpA-OmpF porin [Sinimarinibacterium flocculans]
MRDRIASRFGWLGCLFALAVAQPVLAQDDYEEPAPPVLDGRPWYVSPMFSYSHSDADRGSDDGIGATISVGKKVTSGMTLELTGFFQQMDAEVGDATTDLQGIGLGAMIFPFNGTPNFYGLLALMYGTAEQHPGAIANYDTTVFDIGAGYLYAFNPHIALRAEARYRTDQHDRKQAGVSPGSGAFTDGVFNIGLLFPLGVTPEPVEEEEVEVIEPAPVVADVDTDGDGVPDSLDQCPDTPPGTTVNDVGCPMDSDNDGVPDDIDECPMTPAGASVLANGCALVGDCRKPRAGEQVDANGCAVEQKFILKGVKFEFDSDRLTPDAKDILNDVAGTLQAYPDVEVELEGHTDNIGTDAYNQGLSERRANAVKTYLTGRDIEAGRMTPVGYGESTPIADNSTEEGRDENRRVELKVIED